MAFGIQDNYLKPADSAAKPKLNEVVKQEEPIEDTKPPQEIEQGKEQEKDKSVIITAEEESQKKSDPVEINDDTLLNYLNTKNNTSFESLDAYQQSFATEKEVVKEINPYEDLMDEYDKEYFKYKKETNRSRKEFDFVQQDISKLDTLDLAIRKVKADTGLELSPTDAKAYLENKLNIDLTADELSVNDKIELNSYVKSYRDQLLADQAKYKVPKENKKEPVKNQEPLFVTQDGRQVTQAEYEKEIQTVKTEYLNNIKEGVNSVTSSVFDITIDDNGEKRTINFEYNFSDEDKHSMLSDASDVDAMINKRYTTDNGFSHEKLVKGLWMGDDNNLKKFIKAAMQQARASLLEEIAQRDNNENFSRKSIPQPSKDANGYGDMREAVKRQSGFGLKY